MKVWAPSMLTGSGRRRGPAGPPVRSDGAVAGTIRSLPLKRGRRRRRPFAYSQAWSNCRALGTIRVAEST
jgi:hypothetical protein